jgi:dCMP deaminase
MLDKQIRYDIAYLKMCLEWADLSHCVRKKVGALIVKDGMIISDGFNGVPKGMDNCCELDDNTSHWYVLHAEANAILKLAKSNNSSIGSTLYLTMSPCKECCKLIVQSEIKRVVYIEEYRDTTSLEFLKQQGIIIDKISINEI